MNTPELQLSDEEAYQRLEELGEEAAYRYADALLSSYESYDSDGKFKEDSWKSIEQTNDAILQLAFIGDALARVRPRYEGDSELFWVGSAVKMLKKYSPDMLPSTLFLEKNKEQQREIWRAMIDRIGPKDDEVEDNIPYIHNIALGRIVLKKSAA